MKTIKTRNPSLSKFASAALLLIAILIIPLSAQEEPATLGPGQCLFGDINGDGIVNLLDVEPFQSLLLNNCEFACEADFDQDGSVDLLDYAEFVKSLGGG